MEIIRTPSPTVVQVLGFTAVTVTPSQTVAIPVFRGPPGVSGNAASISQHEGNAATIAPDGGIYVQTNVLSSAQW